MGLPLSRFQILSRLCAREDYVREKFAPFKLTCIVLHDPDDKAFSSQMKKRFWELHRQTGDNMLFMTFIDPPKDWCSPGNDFKEAESMNLVAERGFDSWLIINHLMPVIAPEENLPCLVLTDSLLSPDYILMGTSADRFEDQLIRLGQYCSGSEYHFPVSDSQFQSFLSELGAFRLCHLPDSSIAKAFADVLVLHDLRDGNQEAKDWATRRTRELQAIKDAADGSSGDGGKASGALFMYESAVRRMSRHKPVRSASSAISVVDNDICLDMAQPPTHKTVSPPSLYNRFLIKFQSVRGYNLCHVRSRGNIREYNDSLSLFIPKGSQDESRIKYSYYDEEPQLVPKSFKSLARPLTEFFEREINMTLVQLMRFRFGIEMPDYYREFKPDTFAFVQTGQESVGLNACEYPDRLKAVMLGQAYYAYTSMCEGRSDVNLIDTMGRGFMEEWRKVIKYRNKVGHPDYSDMDFFGYDDFADFHRIFSSILQNSLWKMESIGEALRTGIGLEDVCPEANNLFE